MLAYRILKRLAVENTVLTNKKLSEELNSSPAKVRDKIEYLSKIMDKDIAEIVKKRGPKNGYSLVVYDRKRYQSFLEKLYQEELDERLTANNPSFRVEAITLKLLNITAPIKSEDLAEELMISSRQLNNDLKVVRQFLHEYSLRIVSKPYYGMYIEGTEFRKRLCLANLYIKNPVIVGASFEKTVFENIENTNMIKWIRAIVLEESAKFDIKFSDVALNNLAVHLFIIIHRSSYFEQNGIEENTEAGDKEKKLTNAIISKIDREFSITLNEYDYQCLEIHIVGKRAYLNDDISFISEEMKNFTSDLLQLIDESYKTNFQKDESLAIRLQLHFLPMFIRMRNDVVLKNPIIEEIKSRYIFSYEIALMAGEEIERRYNKKLTEDELSYIALHFEVSLYQTTRKKYKVLIICHTGTCSAEILKQQILSKFSDYVSQLDICAVNQIGCISFEEYSFAFTTIPIQIFTQTPIYEINDFLDDKNIQFINKVFEWGDFSVERIRKYFPRELFLGVISADTREDVIWKMTKVIRKYRPIPDHFFESVMEREAIASTDYGKFIAIPHPIHMSKEGLTYTSVAILKKPIRWGKNIVRVVFLNNISKGEGNLQYYYYLLSSFTTDEEKVKALVQKPDYENLVWLLYRK